MRGIPRRESFSIRLILATLVLIGAQFISGAQARAAVGFAEVERDAAIHAPPGTTLPAELADPWSASSLRVFGSSISGARQTAERARYITCDQESERSAQDRSHVAVQTLARLNYCSSIALVHSGSISHLATSVPPPAHRN